MEFRVTDGRYEAALENGDVVRFKSFDEMREVCHQRVEIMRLIRGGAGAAKKRFVACKATSAVAKKKVRISIYPDERVADSNLSSADTEASSVSARTSLCDGSHPTFPKRLEGRQKEKDFTQ